MACSCRSEATSAPRQPPCPCNRKSCGQPVDRDPALRYAPPPEDPPPHGVVPPRPETWAARVRFRTRRVGSRHVGAGAGPRQLRSGTRWMRFGTVRGGEARSGSSAAPAPLPAPTGGGHRRPRWVQPAATDGAPSVNSDRPASRRLHGPTGERRGAAFPGPTGRRAGTLPGSTGQCRGRPSLVRTWIRRTRPGPHWAPSRSSSLPWR